MKKNILLIVSLYICIGFSVASTLKDINGNGEIAVILENVSANNSDPNLYINNQNLPFSLVKTLNDSIITKVWIVKDASAQNKNGDIHVTLKDGYTIQTISLSEIQKKHINNIDSAPCLFFIENELIETPDYDTFVIDNKQIKQISVKRFDNWSSNIHLNLIKIQLENPRKQQIMIR